VAFRARLKHFQRLKFPEGVNVGKGRASKYGAGQLITLALALELAELGLTPERIVGLIRGDYFPVFAAVKRSADVMPPNGEWTAGRRNASLAMFLYFDPSALAQLGASDPLPGSFRHAGAPTISGKLVEAINSVDHRRLALVNVTVLLDALLTFLPRDHAKKFLDDAELWARIGAHGWPGRSLVGEWETE
jgi:hypothetical protein